MLTTRQIELISKAVFDIHDIQDALGDAPMALQLGEPESDFTVGDAFDDLLDIVLELEEVFTNGK
jgi:hypothetical protein